VGRNDIVLDTKRGSATPDALTFNDVTIYWGTLEADVELLEEVVISPETHTFKGAAIDDLTNAGLKKELDDATTVRDAFRRDVGSSPAIKEAIDYFKEVF
jgi:hypothetical protein